MMEVFSNDLFSLTLVIPGYVVIATFRYFNLDQSAKIGPFTLVIFSLFWGIVVFVVMAATFGFWLLNILRSVVDHQLTGLHAALLIALILSTTISVPVGFFGAWFARAKLVQAVQQLFIDAIGSKRLFGFCLLVAYVTTLFFLALSWGILSGRT